VASIEALNLLYQAMCALAYWRIAMAIGMASKVGVFFIVVVLYVTLAPARAIHSRYLPKMAASSGFYQSPELPPLGNALGIATAHPQGHRNGQQRRCICFHHLFWH
jgi:hypothetical protein